MSKPRVVKDYTKLGEDILALIKLKYPFGFEKQLIRFKDKEGRFISALPFETEDRYYLIRMTSVQAKEVIEQDDDYNEDGNLTELAKKRLEDEISDIDIQ